MQVDAEDARGRWTAAQANTVLVGARRVFLGINKHYNQQANNIIITVNDIITNSQITL